MQTTTNWNTNFALPSSAPLNQTWDSQAVKLKNCYDLTINKYADIAGTNSIRTSPTGSGITYRYDIRNNSGNGNPTGDLDFSNMANPPVIQFTDQFQTGAGQSVSSSTPTLINDPCVGINARCAWIQAPSTNVSRTVTLADPSWSANVQGIPVGSNCTVQEKTPSIDGPPEPKVVAGQLSVMD